MLVLLAAQVFLNLWGARSDGQTFDEAVHLFVGYSFLRYGRYYDIDSIHPPFARSFAALPLLLLPPPDPGVAPSRGFAAARQFVYYSSNAPNAEQLLLAARIPIIVLSALLALLLFGWVRSVAGVRIALITMALLIVDPNLLAHGHLVTTDMAVTVFVFAAGYSLYQYQTTGYLRWLLLGGVAAGLAMASKVTGLLLWPALFVVLALELCIAGARQPARSLRLGLPAVQGLIRPGLALAAAVIVAALTLWGTYGFQSGSLLPETAARLAPFPGTNLHEMLAAGLTHLPLPAREYLYTVRQAQVQSEEGQPAFLAGYNSTSWWFYFPVAFLVKTSLPVLLLLGLTLAVCVPLAATRASPAGQAWPIAAGVLIVFALSALTAHMNIGLRHILPVYPYLYLLLGMSLHHVSTILSGARLRCFWGFVTACSLWAVVEIAIVAPRFLTYFNELAGGPRNGYHWLVDSNLDWGQSLPELASYLRQFPRARTYIVYFGTAPLSHYDLVAQPLHFTPDGVPEPGLYAISASALQVPAYTSLPLDYFRARPPDDLVGNTILIYVVPASE